MRGTNFREAQFPSAGYTAVMQKTINHLRDPGFAPVALVACMAIASINQWRNQGSRRTGAEMKCAPDFFSGGGKCSPKVKCYATMLPRQISKIAYVFDGTRALCSFSRLYHSSSSYSKRVRLGLVI